MEKMYHQEALVKAVSWLKKKRKVCKCKSILFAFI